MDSFLAVKSALRNGSNSHDLEQPPTIKNHHTHYTNKLHPILELENTLHDKLQVKDEDLENPSDSLSDEDGSSGLDDENISNPEIRLDVPTSMASRPLHKCATLPEENPELHPEDYAGRSRPLSVPTPRKLVSAMKGTREKEGIPKMKLSVTWAPDVYDPPPTSVSHYPKKKSHHQYSKSYKKHGKGKQKGKNVRGGSGSKEKKHYRKSGGSSNRSMQSYIDTDRLDNYNSSVELVDFSDPGIGSPDPNCGSKFLGQASGTTHCVY